MGRWMARRDGGKLMGFPLDLSFFFLFCYFFSHLSFSFVKAGSRGLNVCI